MPQLAELMLQYNNKREFLFNLRGIAVSVVLSCFHGLSVDFNFVYLL